MKKTTAKIIGWYFFLLVGCGYFSISGRAAESASNLEVHFIDVGQGDAILITNNGKAMLIDAGEAEKGLLVNEYLRDKGIRKLEYVIGTHPHADHIGGLAHVINEFECGEIIMPRHIDDEEIYGMVIHTMESLGYESTVPVSGMEYSLGDARFTVISPGYVEFDKTNDYSIVILMEYGEHKFLFAGDIMEEAEAQIMRSGFPLSADVYKVSHHGSYSFMGNEFLKRVMPDYAVISCGNYYDNPDIRTLHMLYSAGITVFRTDEQGTIVAVSDGMTLTWLPG